jgi:hypothetical protein
MNRRVFVFSMFALAVKTDASLTTLRRKNSFEPDLSGMAQGKGWQVLNRNVSLIDPKAKKKGVRFDERAGVGVAWLKDYEFENGIIEFDVRGKNVLQKSFVGIAFHAQDETTYDCIYFRPFNFRSEDPLRRSHAVQYISPPTFTWEKLRAESPLKYEQPVQPAPDPEAWFRARVVVASPKVSVFVNEASQPCLVIKQLGERKGRSLGLWAGDASGGDFAKLKITPAK